jgi:Protein of unknown function (DUF2752)
LEPHADQPAGLAKLGFVAARLIAALWGLMIVGGLVIGASGSESWRDAVASNGPGCPFRGMTGIDCPFCGMTRATLALGGGEFSRAIELHPLAPLVVIGVLGLLFIVAIGRAEWLLRGRRSFVLLGAILAIWVLRLVL